MRVILSLVLVGLFSGVALAQQDQYANSEREVPAKGMSERTYNSLNDSYEDIGNDNYAKAYEDMQRILNRVKSNDYETAVVEQAMGFAALGQERYGVAIGHFERALNADVLPNYQHFAIMLQLAQVYMIQEDYRQTIAWVDRWMTESKASKPEAHVLKANSYAQLEQYRQGIVEIKQAIAMHENPQRAWYQLLLSMHLELKQYNEAAVVLRGLIVDEPNNRRYWSQLASIYINLKRDQEALNVLKLAHRNGLFEEGIEYRQLASLYSYLDVPLKSAEILAEGMERGLVERDRKSYEQLGNAYQAAFAYDDALVALEQAGSRSSDGKIDLRRGYIYVDREDWAEAEQALQMAVDKRGLNQNEYGNALTMLGMTQYELGKTQTALSTLRQARQTDSSRRAADQWIRHITDELERQEQIAAERAAQEANERELAAVESRSG